MTRMPGSQPISTATAPHYLWGELCDGWHLVQTPTLAIIEERMPPATSERQHLHQHAQQFFYVLEGCLSIELDGEQHTLQVGEGLAILPGQRHQVRNESTAEVRFLVTSQPPSHGDRADV